MTNQLDNTVSAYEITLATGTPTAAVNATGQRTNSTDTEPVAIVVDPALGRFVYTANYLGNSVSGFALDPTSGALKATQSTPYPTGEKPTAIVSVPHGNHATQIGHPVTAASSQKRRPSRSWLGLFACVVYERRPYGTLDELLVRSPHAEARG